jgi:putative nucleotidyltransferase-like protein
MTASFATAQPSSLSPEQRVVLLLSRGRFSNETAGAALSLLGPSLLWDEVMNLVEKHETYPLVWRNLQQLRFENVPEEIQSRLEALFRANALRNAIVADELGALLRLLDSQAIPAIPLKGLPLAEALYGSFLFRVCADMDILIPAGDIPRALNLLTGLGYRLDCPAWFPGKFKNANLFEFSLTRTGRGAEFQIELHHDLTWFSAVHPGRIQAFWERATRQRWRNSPTWTLDREDQFLMLLMHAARHDWRGLKWLVDLDAAWQGGLSWDKLAERADRFQLRRVVQRGICICSTLFGHPLPREFSQTLPIPDLNHFLAPPCVPDLKRSFISSRDFAAGRWEMFRLLGHRLLGPTTVDASAVHLPRSLCYLYYGVRPLRLCWRAARSLVSSRPPNASR